MGIGYVPGVFRVYLIKIKISHRVIDLLCHLLENWGNVAIRWNVSTNWAWIRQAPSIQVFGTRLPKKVQTLGVDVCLHVDVLPTSVLERNCHPQNVP